MSEVVKVVMEWKYTPKNYFEEPISISDEGFTLDISDGSAVAKIEPTVFNKYNELSSKLSEMIKSRLYAVQIMTHRKFTLSKPSRIDLNEDGTRNIYLTMDPITIKTSTGMVDIILKDKDGHVISDSKQERLDKQKWIALAMDKFRSADETLDQMLKSHQMAANDPDNELVHLYEVRDALSKKFGDQTKAKKHLSITEGDWNTLGDLANNQPLKQGRHRGKSAGILRDATASELELARKITQILIEKYLKYLEQE